MTGRSRRQRCVTCTPSEWRAIKAKARAAGFGETSAFILSRVLDGEAPDGPAHPEAGYPMALTGAEQRRQLEAVERFACARGPLMKAPFIPGTGTMIGQGLDFVTRSLEAGGPASGGSGARTDPGFTPEAGSAPERRTADAPDAAPATDPRPRQADLFEGTGAGPAPGDGAAPGDFLDDLVDELNRDGDP